MADRTGIQWTDATWNPIVGCSLASPGCTNCYAMRMAARIEAMQPGSHYAGTTMPGKAGPVWTGKVALAPDHILTQPLRWRRPRTIFVNSMGDLFHEDVPFETIAGVFGIMNAARRHTFQVLTKRSSRMRAFFTWLSQQTEPKARWVKRVNDAEKLCDEPQGNRGAERHHAECIAIHAFAITLGAGPSGLYTQWPLPNVWLGVSAEDQRRADERIPDLLATPAAIRFVSAEPLLGGLDLTQVGNLSSIRAAFPGLVERQEHGRPRNGDGSISGFQIDAVGNSGSSIEFFQTPDHMGGFSAASPRAFPRLDLVIVGGENGPRPMHPDWARSLRDQCAATGTAYFFKQWGEWLDESVASAAGMAPGPDMFDRYGNPTGPRWHPYDASDRNGGAMIRVGKARAGRLLDGREHNDLPGRISA